jgi:hypothetical protein
MDDDEMLISADSDQSDDQIDKKKSKQNTIKNRLQQQQKQNFLPTPLKKIGP